MTGGAEGGFNGEVYDRIGLVDDGLTNSSRPWLRYDLSNRTVDEVTGPPPSSWGSNHLWKLKGHCKGAAYFF